MEKIYYQLTFFRGTAPSLEMVVACRETEKSIWISNGRSEIRKPKVNSYRKYIESKEEAFAEFEEKTTAILERSEKLVASCKEKLSALQALKSDYETD